MVEHWRIAGVYSADSVTTTASVAIWEGHRRFLCAVPQEIAEQIVEAVNDRARLLGEVEKLKAALQMIRDHYGRICENSMECEHQSCASSYGAWATADEALAATPAVTTGCAPCSAGERPIETEWPLITRPRRGAEHPEERMSDTEQAALDAAYLAWLADQTRLSSWAAAWQAGRDWARLEAADRQAALAAELGRLRSAGDLLAGITRCYLAELETSDGPHPDDFAAAVREWEIAEARSRARAAAPAVAPGASDAGDGDGER
jgi:hypothetical protein